MEREMSPKTYKEIDWTLLSRAQEIELDLSVVGYRPGRACMARLTLLCGSEVLGTTTSNMLNSPISVASLRALTKSARLLKHYKDLECVIATIKLDDVPTFWLLSGARVSAHTAEKRAMSAFRQEFSLFQEVRVKLETNKNLVNNYPVNWLEYLHGNRKDCH